MLDKITKYIQDYIKITTDNSTKYFLAKKNEDGTSDFPLECLQKKDNQIPVIMYYQIFPFKDDHVIVKVMLRYVDYNIMYNNDKYYISWLINNPKMLGNIRNEYYFMFTFLQYIQEKEKIFNTSHQPVCKNLADKVNRYDYIKNFISTYQERLFQVYKSEHSFKEITDIIRYMKNETFIKQIERFPFLKKYLQKKYNLTFIDLDNKSKQIMEGIKNVFKKQENLYPLLFWYLSIENDHGFYKHPETEKEVDHLFYSFENEALYDVLLKDAQQHTGYIIKQGYLVLNLGVYYSMLEEYYTYLFFKNRIRRNTTDLKADISTSKEDKMTVKIEELLYDTWLSSFLKVIELAKNDYLLWSYENIITLAVNNRNSDDMFISNTYEEIGRQFNKSFKPFQWDDSTQGIQPPIPQAFIEQGKTQIYQTKDFFKIKF